MENKLSREEVEHVLELAKIKASEEEIEKYRVELKKILDDIDKIKDVKGYDDEIIIAPFSDDARSRDDVSGEMLEAKEVLKNVPRHSGNYIEVPVVINE